MADRRGGDRRRRDSRRDDEREELDERVVDIKRVAKVIKGGRRFAFRTVVIVGDNKGRVGVGVGKARGVPDSIRKASGQAKKNMQRVALSGSTIPYQVTARHGGAKVLLKPAAPGTGVIAGGGVRAVLEAAGVSDVLTKSQGSANLLNVAMATIHALEQLRSPEEIAQMRGKPIEDVLPFWERRAAHKMGEQMMGAGQVAEEVADIVEDAEEVADIVEDAEEVADVVEDAIENAVEGSDGDE